MLIINDFSDTEDEGDESSGTFEVQPAQQIDQDCYSSAGDSVPETQYSDKIVEVGKELEEEEMRTALVMDSP